MKNSLKKVLAGVSATAMLASAMPITSAFAAQTIEVKASFDTREVEGGVVITKYTGEEADEIVIPSVYEEKSVVGVDDYAFALISKEVTIVVPATLSEGNIGDEAFLTAAVVNKGIVESSEDKTINGIVKHWIKTASGLTYSDEEINDAVSKAYSHIGSVAAGTTIEETALLVIKEIQAGNCGFSQVNIDRLDLALSMLPYTPVTLKGAADAYAKTYAGGKINLKYVEAGGIIGDINGDGVVNFYDAVAIAKSLIGTPLTPEQKAVGDVNGDGDVNFYDAVAIAKSLLK